MKIIGLTSGSYPYGTATSTRNMLLFKGLKEQGLDVTLLSIYPDKNQDPQSNRLSGIYEGVHYQYTLKNLHFKKRRVRRMLQMLFSTLRCIRHVKNEAKKQEVVAFIYINTPLLSFIITRQLRRKNIRILHEVTEFPFLRRHNNYLRKKLYLKRTVPKFDKIFVISTALKEYFAEITHPNRIEILNMFVDLGRFQDSFEPVYDFDYIAYCGSMNTDKDGVPILIEAFSEVIKQYRKLKLVLMGDIQNRPIDINISETIKKLKLENTILFTGYINSTQIPKYLKGAKILALARPDNIQAEGGFPTKLGEYLATGKPVVVTRVGDIPNFISDGINGYLSEPNSRDFARKIIEILHNYSTASKVGESGRKLAENKFNYKTEVLKIKKFIESQTIIKS